MQGGEHVDELLKDIGLRIRKVRMERKMTQDDLAEALGMSSSFVSNLELGKQSMNIRTLITIVQKLGISADWLIGNTTPSSIEIDAESLSKELDACSAPEREAILSIVQFIRNTLNKLKLDEDK